MSSYQTTDIEVIHNCI